MTTGEQHNLPFRPLAVCGDKFSEAYRFAMDGDPNVRLLNGTEAAPFVLQGTYQHHFFILHRPASGQELQARELRFWLMELVELAVRSADSLIVERNYVILEDDSLHEVALFRAPWPAIGDTFDPGIIDLAELTPEINNLPRCELEGVERQVLLSRVQAAIPVVH